MAITGTIQRLAALTDAKRNQLNNNNRCRKCHCLNIYHISKNCLNGFPDAAMYTRLINHPLHPPPPPAPTAPTPVTTAPVASTSSNTLRNRSHPRPVAAVGSWADETAATFPSAFSALEGGSDTEDEDADDVSAPFHAPHLWWKACVSGPDTEFPITGLCCRPLPKPETVDVTVKTSNALSRTTLTKWVKLSVTSEDGL